MHPIPDEQFKQCPRFERHELSDDQIEEIAERAAIKAVQKATDGFYKDVGKRVVGGVYWVVGVGAVGLFVVGVHLGWIKP